ncbi:DNA-directed RNA polymerase subunit RPB1 [uncultured virus]|nr:DNA-directed RNA polymerase subunit RPB1 [uncultured virus]
MSGGWFNSEIDANPERKPIPLPFEVIDSIVNSLTPIPCVDQEAGALARQYHMVKTRNELMKISLIPDVKYYDLLKDRILSKYERSKIVNDERIGMFAAETLSNGVYQITMDTFSVAGQDLIIGSGLRNVEALLNVQMERNDPKVVVHFDPAYGRAPSYHYTQNDVVDMRAQLVQMTVEDFILPDGVEIGPFESFEGDNVSDDLRRLREITMDEMAMNAQPFGWWDRLFMISDPNGHLVSSSITVMRVRFDVTLMYAHRVTLQMIVDAISLGKIPVDELIMIQSSFTEGIIDFMTGEDFRVLRGAAGYESIKDAPRKISELLFFNGILKPHFRNLKVKGITALTELNPVEVNVMTAIKSSSRANRYQVARHGYKMMQGALGFETPHEKFIDRVYSVQSSDLKNDWSFAEISVLNGRTVFHPLGTVPKTLIIGKLSRDEVINYEMLEFYDPEKYNPDDVDHLFSQTWVLKLDLTTIKIKGVSIRVLREILALVDIKIIRELNDELLISHLAEIYVLSAEDPVRLMEAYLNSSYNLERIFDVIDDGTISKIKLKDSSLPVISSATIKSIIMTSDLSLDHPVTGTAAEVAARIKNGMSKNESYDKEDRFTITQVRDHLSIRFKKTIGAVETSYFLDVINRATKDFFLSLRVLIDPSIKMMSQQKVITFLKRLMLDLGIKENHPLPIDSYNELKRILGDQYLRFYKVDASAVMITVNDYQEKITEQQIVKILQRAELALGVNEEFSREEIIAKLQKALPDPDAKLYQKYVYGVVTVMHPAVAKKQLFKEKEKTSVYKQLLMFPWIDRKKTISNDLREIQRTLGVEASRNYFLYELTQTLAAFKVTPNIRHVLIVADFIYRMGHPIGLGRSGISQHRIGFMSEAIVGNSAQQLIKSYRRDDEPISHIGPATVLGAISLPRSRHPQLIAESQKRATRDELTKANRLRAAKENLEKHTLSFELEGNFRYYTDDAPTLEILPDGTLTEVSNVNKFLAIDLKDDDTEADEYMNSAAIGVSFLNEIDAKNQDTVPLITFENLPKISPVTWKDPDSSGLLFSPFLKAIREKYAYKATLDATNAKQLSNILEKTIQSSSKLYGFVDMECVDDASDFVDVGRLHNLLSKEG